MNIVMVKKILVFLLLSAFGTYGVYAQGQYAFKVLPLGIKGGLDESNLSGYMIAPAGSDHFICADAGTLRYGINKAIGNRVFNSSADEVLKNKIKGYLVSHAHLDHIAGMIMNSPDDSPKNIYAIPAVIEILKTKYFTWPAWANFANEGEAPALKKYTYVYLEEKKEQILEGTEMTVVPFLLSHGNPYQSTAFLLNAGQNYLLYLGDTGADSIEKSDRLKKLWQEISPLIEKDRLKAIFIETSFPNGQAENQLFGHLTPRLLMQEMDTLGQLTGKTALQKVPIVITHMKAFGREEALLKKEIKENNSLGLKLVFPEQGKVLEF
jgi:cAMP phosphodiesterase